MYHLAVFLDFVSKKKREILPKKNRTVEQHDSTLKGKECLPILSFGSIIKDHSSETPDSELCQLP